jgi:hypothetical protein
VEEKDVFIQRENEIKYTVVTIPKDGREIYTLKGYREPNTKDGNEWKEHVTYASLANLRDISKWIPVIVKGEKVMAASVSIH